MIVNKTQLDGHVALKDSSSAYTYAELRVFCDGFLNKFHLRGRDLLFMLCENTVAAAAFFLGCIENRVVPLLLKAQLDADMLTRYITTYRPGYIYKPANVTLDAKHTRIGEFMNYELVKIDGAPAAELYEDLSFLLPTSGSTGSPKLVRHSYKNLSFGAENVSAVFGLDGSENAMLSLPIYFTQGLSVLYSHLYAGASVYLTDEALTGRAFWDAMKNERITSFTGVPYSFEVLDRYRFYLMPLPDLRVISQGGGRMTDELFGKLADYAEQTGRKFYATYGASETTARMCCLPPECAARKRGSIGRPLPNCEIRLLGEDGNEIVQPNEKGEIVFKGGNVTLGYAECAENLRLGDERHGEYRTGDLAYRDEDGFYFIVGRLSRFVKIFGYRISLDETERLLKAMFGNDLACAGNDEQLVVFSSDTRLGAQEVCGFLRDKLQMNLSAFKYTLIDEIPKNQYGKTAYAELNKRIIQREESKNA